MTLQQTTGARRFGGSVLAAIALAAAGASVARADSTPVGPLPNAKVTSVTTSKGALVSIAVDSQLPPTGLVWRIARPLNAKVVRQVGEGEVAGTTVLLFRVVGRGKASIVLALTRGDTSPKAVSAVRYSITAR
jgi:hypothetical protein